MANEQINEYAVTAASFLPGSFMDIDQLIAPGVWESQKIDFSAMFTQFGNIYNYDGTITEQRTLDGNAKTKGLFFIDLQTFTVRAAALEFESDVDIKLITDPVGALILPSDADPVANVGVPIEFMIKGDTTTDDLLVYVGATWESVAFTSDLITIYNSDGTLSGNRIIDANGNNFTINNVSNFLLDNVGQITWNDTANIAFNIQQGGTTLFSFGASSVFNAHLFIGSTTSGGTALEQSISLQQGRGILITKLNQVAETALAAPGLGLFLFNKDENRFRGYDGAAFQSFAYSTGVQESTTVTTSSGPAAVAITGGRHDITTTGTGDAMTLANGAPGQKLKVVYVAETAGADTAILTPTTLLGYATITFNAIGDSVALEYGTGGWSVVGNPLGATLA